MVGADPEFPTHECVSRLTTLGTARQIRRGTRERRRFPRGWRWMTLISAVVPLSFALLQYRQAPGADTLAAKAQPSARDSLERFSNLQFNDRFPTANESFEQRRAGDLLPKAQSAPATYRVASLTPQLPHERPMRGDQTTLVSLKSSAFPYLGNNPRTDEPFLNVSKGERRGHRGMGGKVFWQDQTFSDSRVLMHVPENFDIRKPGVIVVFFHGNGATLERDVRDRQKVPQQISDSGANAVLLAPQLAVDAADSSAGKFWQPGGLKRFIAESADHLATLYGDPRAAKAFGNMPIVIVGYSGGFLPTAWSLDVGGLNGRVRGVFLLDAVYGELDKFASWIENNRSGFFVSSYTHYTARRDRELMQMLRNKDIAVSDNMNGPLKPGSVVFVATPEGVTHRDYVTRAWTKNPLEDVLVKMAATPALTRMAAGTASPASR